MNRAVGKCMGVLSLFISACMEDRTITKILILRKSLRGPVSQEKVRFLQTIYGKATKLGEEAG